jgi:hypothetical protein
MIERGSTSEKTSRLKSNAIQGQLLGYRHRGERCAAPGAKLLLHYYIMSMYITAAAEINAMEHACGQSTSVLVSPSSPLPRTLHIQRNSLRSPATRESIRRSSTMKGMSSTLAILIDRHPLLMA